ncbi:MAG: cysteine desulfurase family protein [Actinomycetaceae bacterium]|nr:cysteine desulfurase family protein [Actinomycetaceae bacterium]
MGTPQAKTGVYLDYAATMPMREAALQAWEETVRTLQATPGNPAALHGGGRHAKHLLEDAREKVAGLLGVSRAEVIFTSGATEANALGIVGCWRAHPRSPGGPVQVCAADHPSSFQQAQTIQREGGIFNQVPIDANGQMQVEYIDPQATVVSVAAVSSEIGVIQPLPAIAAALGEDTVLHVDATQAIHTQHIDLAQLQVGALTLAGHKIGAPVGIGALVVRRGVKLHTDRPGGDQESKRRSGTVDVAGATALATALEICVQEREDLIAHTKKLRSQLLSQLPPGCHATVKPQLSAPNIIHLSLPTAHPEAVLMRLDSAGIWASAGSACHAGVTRPSRVVLAMGRTQEQALGVLRISIHRTTSADDINRFLHALPTAVEAGKALDALG